MTAFENNAAFIPNVVFSLQPHYPGRTKGTAGLSYVLDPFGSMLYRLPYDRSQCSSPRLKESSYVDLITHRLAPHPKAAEIYGITSPWQTVQSAGICVTDCQLSSILFSTCTAELLFQNKDQPLWHYMTQTQLRESVAALRFPLRGVFHSTSTPNHTI